MFFMCLCNRSLDDLIDSWLDLYLGYKNYSHVPIKINLQKINLNSHMQKLLSRRTHARNIVRT